MLQARSQIRLLSMAKREKRAKIHFSSFAPLWGEVVPSRGDTQQLSIGSSLAIGRRLRVWCMKMDN